MSQCSVWGPNYLKQLGIGGKLGEGLRLSSISRGASVGKGRNTCSAAFSNSADGFLSPALGSSDGFWPSAFGSSRGLWSSAALGSAGDISRSKSCLFVKQGLADETFQSKPHKLLFGSSKIRRTIRKPPLVRACSVEEHEPTEAS
jgi:hypothetical protein